MCGRYTLGVDLDELRDALGDPEVRLEEHRPRYNVAPTQEAPVLIRGEDGLRLGSLRWGLIPHWADDPAIGSRMINARSETVASKPAFRDAFRRRRCLVPTDGFYEWRAGERGRKTPYWIHLPGGGVFTFAALWERWRPPEGPPLHTFTILTTEASEELRPYHSRMPVVVAAGRREVWLDPSAGGAELAPMLEPAPDDTFRVREVSTFVNSPANESPKCVRPVDAPT